jgi:hypothetical protein
VTARDTRVPRQARERRRRVANQRSCDYRGSLQFDRARSFFLSFFVREILWRLVRKPSCVDSLDEARGSKRGTELTGLPALAHNNREVGVTVPE